MNTGGTPGRDVRRSFVDLPSPQHVLGIDDLEIAVAECIDWFNHRRLHGEIGLVPPAEHEADFYRHHTAATTVAASVPSLH